MDPKTAPPEIEATEMVGQHFEETQRPDQAQAQGSGSGPGVAFGQSEARRPGCRAPGTIATRVLSLPWRGLQPGLHRPFPRISTPSRWTGFVPLPPINAALVPD